MEIFGHTISTVTGRVRFLRLNGLEHPSAYALVSALRNSRPHLPRTPQGVHIAITEGSVGIDNSERPRLQCRVTKSSTDLNAERGVPDCCFPPSVRSSSPYLAIVSSPERGSRRTSVHNGWLFLCS